MVATVETGITPVGKITGPCDGKIGIREGEQIALCCSGGGIRSATFNLGVIQALQATEFFSAVKTVTAVSGGSYLAAARALVTANPPAPEGTQEGGQERGGPDNPLPPPPAYDLRSPEELHLRDHTRYLLESWQVTVRAIGMLIRGALVNAILVGSVIYICGHLAGWLLGAPWAGILSGLQAGSPKAALKWYWLIPAILAAVTVVLAWVQAMPDKPQARQRKADKDNGGNWSTRALRCTLVTGFVLVAAPLALKALYSVSLGNGSWSTITRFLGFSSGQACHAAARAAVAARQAHHQVCGVAAALPSAATSSGAEATQLPVWLTTFGGAGAAIVALARTTIGRLRTFQTDLKSSPFAGVNARLGAFLRQRLVPWTGSVIIVAGLILFALRCIGSAASVPPTHGGWNSPLARCLYALALYWLLKALIDINSTSMHGFYRDRLAAAYGVVRSGSEALPASWARLSMLRGGPELVICAAANCTTVGDLPPGRGCVSFTFTPEDIGLSRSPTRLPCDPKDRTGTLAYEEKTRLTLFDAVAVSGAAVSPVMGKMTRPAMRILLAAAGARLGVWLPSPKTVTQRPQSKAPRWLRSAGSALVRRVRQPDLVHLWAEAVGSLHLNGKWIYVTDGGHYENLGMVEALRRTPDHLIVVDASGDTCGEFSTLGQAIALARSELGVQVTIRSVDDLKPNDQGLSPQPYVLGEFSYPGRPAGPHHLIYLKLAVPVTAPLDVIAYQHKHSSFPTASTLQQLYNDQEFEAYRELGYYCAQAAAMAVEYVRR